MSVRVLIVDDSALTRDLLRLHLEADPSIEVVGEAANGQEAIDLNRTLRPNVITMDLKMPVLDGVAAVTEIMATDPVPILVVSSISDAAEACEAIAHGALDAMGKPEMDEVQGAEFVAKVKMIASIRVITHLKIRPNSPPPPATTGPLHPAPPDRVFAIASSTGGPQALAALLGALPAAFPCPVLVGQHIAHGFALGLARWLAGTSRLPVQLAVDGEPLLPGRVYLSPSEANLTVTKSRRIALLPQGRDEIYHPSCDLLLSSVASVYGAQAVGVILTGMGRDGAQGMEKIRRAGGPTLAQDEASSVIYGMNKVAIDLGVVDKVLPLLGVAEAMVRLSQRVAPAGAL